MFGLPLITEDEDIAVFVEVEALGVSLIPVTVVGSLLVVLLGSAVPEFIIVFLAFLGVRENLVRRGDLGVE